MFKLLATTLVAAYVMAKDQTGDGKRDFQELAVKNGFQFEQHTVTTEDGYILTVWRIPGLKGETKKLGKPTILMQHGVLDSANCWVMHYPEVAPAFVAARAGYDVWLGNSRGNTYSRKHVKYSPDKNQKKFWAFDWEQMGQYDIPAVLDHMTAQTGVEKHAYVGHSQGTTQMYYGAAMPGLKKYFESKISIFVALGPVTKVSHTSSTIFKLAKDFYVPIDHAASTLGIHELLGKTWLTDRATKLFCNAVPYFCRALQRAVISSDPKADDLDRFQVYMDHEPNGTSVQAILLYAQNMKEDRFQVWAPDYNKYLDIGQHRKTDLIPIEDIKIPIAMFEGKADKLADPIDAKWTADTIGKSIVHYQEIEGGHLTFMIAKDMSYWSNDVMSILQKYQPVTKAAEAYL